MSENGSYVNYFKGIIQQLMLFLTVALEILQRTHSPILYSNVSKNRQKEKLNKKNQNCSVYYNYSQCG